MVQPGSQLVVSSASRCAMVEPCTVYHMLSVWQAWVSMFHSLSMYCNVQLIFWLKD